jgi:hypothetical protein
VELAMTDLRMQEELDSIHLLMHIRTARSRYLLSDLLTISTLVHSFLCSLVVT